jgi:uncharacterized membrane protein YfcA
MTPGLEILALLGVGFVSAVVNTIAGGGTLLTVPAMVLMGFGPLTANATNRAALVVQSLSATAHYRRAGAVDLGLSLRFSGIACVGAALGAWLATRLDERTFGHVLAVLMIGALVFLLLRPARWFEARPESGPPHPLLASLGLFGVGAYGGFFGAGVGIFILLLLSAVLRLDLVAGNTVKSVMVLALSLTATVVFGLLGQIDYAALLPLAAGNALGGWVGAHLSLKGGNAWIRRFLLVAVLAGVYKLVLYP